MADRKIGIRFCGGCNSGYDRKKVTEKIINAFPDLIFENVAVPGSYMAVLVVCGCSSACAGIGDLSVPEDRLIYIQSYADLLPAKNRIEAICREEEESENVRSLNITQIRQILPHREPILLIDSVSRLKRGREITAEYTVDPANAVLLGHFPDNPIFPGAFSVEAMAQAADIMMLTLEDYKGKLPLLYEVRKAKCRSVILPGIKLEIHASLVKERRELGSVEVRCQIFHGEKLVAEAELALMIK